MIFSQDKKRDKEKDKEILLDRFPSSSGYAESYRTLRTNLFFAAIEKDLKSVVVTSSVEKEGKTNTSVNTASTIAQTERKVLLIDFDLRRPHLSALFDMKKETGVTGLVADVLGNPLTEGSLKDYSVDDLIKLSNLQGRTCRLDLEDEQNQISVFFEKGKMIDIYWRNRPDSKKLANTLLKENLVSEEEVSLALGHQKKSVQRLGTILYTMGFVSKKDISKALSLHIIEAIQTLSAMEKGKFSFSGASSEDFSQLIEQDISIPNLYKEFNVQAKQGSFLKNAIDSAIRPTGTENLFILPAGTIPSNPAELAGSRRSRFLIDYLKNVFDFIIIDTPPVIPATDALLLASATEGAILVIRSGHTDRKIVQEAVSQFETAGQPVIGTVLNRFDLRKEGYYRYYNKYYSSYYGE